MTHKPYYPKFSKGKLTNWRELRRAKLGRLLEGLKSSNLTTLQILRRRSLKERYCPNNIAIATAATLEDYLPDKVDPAEIAELYAKCSGCFKKNTVNMEHFLTRAGLLFFWSEKYKEAEHVLKQIRPTDAYIGRATYWLLQAQLKLGKKEKAKETLDLLLSKYSLSFHALVAALSSDHDPDQLLLHPNPEIKKRSSRSPSTNKILYQIETLHQYGFHETAHVLAAWAYERSKIIETSVRLYLAQLASPHFKVIHLPHLFIRNRKLISLESMKLAYPLPYESIFKQYRFNNDPLILFAIGRKESKFDPHATSPASAKGILQIHPDRAQQLAPDMELDLYNLHTNIALGSYHLSDLLGKMNGKIQWALAAYNASEEVAESWKKRFTTPNPVLQIDLITYRETRNYISMVLVNYYWYRRLYEKEKLNPVRDLLSLPQKALVDDAPNPPREKLLAPAKDL